MKRKYYISFGIVPIFLLALFISINKDESTSKKLSINGDISATNNTSNINNTVKRPIFSEYENIDLDFIAEKSDLVVVGEVISDGVTKQKTVQRSEKQIEKENSLGIKPLTYNITDTKIKVNEVINGNLNLEEINLIQLGSADSDDTETKVKKGKKFVLLLRKHPNTNNVYSSVNFEDGIFEIDNSDKIHVLSEKYNLKKYDASDIKDFKKIINDLAKNK